MITKVEGFFIPDLKNPEVNKFEVFVPRMSAKAEREYIAKVVGTDDFKISNRTKARIPLNLDIMTAIEDNIADIADFFKENEEE